MMLSRSNFPEICSKLSRSPPWPAQTQLAPLVPSEEALGVMLLFFQGVFPQQIHCNLGNSSLRFTTEPQQAALHQHPDHPWPSCHGEGVAGFILTWSPTDPAGKTQQTAGRSDLAAVPGVVFSISMFSLRLSNVHVKIKVRLTKR